MADKAQINPSDKGLVRLALCLVLLAWAILALYIFISFKGFNSNFPRYFLSSEQSWIRFRALILLAPLFLTIVGYLISEREKLFKKILLREKDLRQRSIELDRINELLTRENAERKKAEERLVHSAFYDSLTNLPNRALFMDHLQYSMGRIKRYQDYLFAVLFLDVDRFKVINDSVGHLVGDQLLIMLAQRLKKHIRSSDTIARFGGDEFVILLDDIKEAAYVDSFISRIQDEMRHPFSVCGHEVFISLSIGMVFSNLRASCRPEEVLRDADTAMYHAKSRGRGCCAIFDSTMHAQATMELRLETDLRKALERGEFCVYYQPVMSLKNNKVVSLEALLRWQHPYLGLLCPSQFITIAEETGLIVPIGEWVIRQACMHMSAWKKKSPRCRDMTVSVNISALVFFQSNFSRIIESILQDSGLEGHCLRLEITERMLMDHPEMSATLIKQLKVLNVSVDIDDFGTGYSALNYLRHFPIHGLKIDGSFISALTFDRDNAEIVKTIISLGHKLNLEVIAEGIETIEQLEVFKSADGRHAQGFFLHRPMDSRAAEALLSRE